jgi:putative addiction module killer protein
MLGIQIYLDKRGREPYTEWLKKLKDRQAVARIVLRVSRMAGGNFGDVKPVGQGVWEARIDHGPGYRVYFSQSGNRVVLLLLGGNKKTQQTDITKAQAFWVDWQKRNTK